MKILLAILVLVLSGCGYESRDSEAIGQVKRVIRKTPIICPNWVELDLSLGVMRQGVGSMSTQDLILYVPNEAMAKQLEEAAAAGQLVKVKYDVARITWCITDHIATSVETIKP